MFLSAGTLIVSAAAVYALRNTVRGPYVKAFAAAIAAGLGSAGSALVEGDHDIDCRIEGIGPMGLKSMYVKKV